MTLTEGKKIADLSPTPEQLYQLIRALEKMNTSWLTYLLNDGAINPLLYGGMSSNGRNIEETIEFFRQISWL